VFQDVEGADQVELRIRTGQGADRAMHRAGALAAQLAQRLGAQVDEAGVLQRQARAQARRDFQAARRQRGQFTHQRPGIEAFRRHQPGFGPQRLIKAAISGEQVGIAARRGREVGGHWPSVALARLTSE
jgi:hypothetical protein